MNVARASAITMSSWMPGGALVLTFPASLTEYSKDSSSSIASGQITASGVVLLLRESQCPSKMIAFVFLDSAVSRRSAA